MKFSNFIGILFVIFCVYHVEKVIAKRKLIVVLIDGVRWDYLDDPDLKGFRRLAENGVKAKYVNPIYPSLSYPNWYSIVTGLYPENHGFIHNNMYDNATGMFYGSLSDPQSTEPLWWNEAEPIWITAEKNNMSTAMYWWGGCEVRIKDHHPMICERERFGPPTPEEREDFLERIEDIIEMFKPSKRFPKDRLSLALMYYGPTDYSGHYNGPKSREVKEALKDIDGILDKMQSKLDKAKLAHEVNIMVVSDHGMTDLRNSKYVDLESFRGDIKYQVSSGTDSMIVPVDGKLDKLYKDMKQANIIGVDVYKKEEIPSKYHVKDSKRMTPLYLIAKKGFVIKTLKKYGPSSSTYLGGHGYDPTVVEDMRTIFLASGPDFKKGYKSEALNITDLYNVMCNILQLSPLPNNGSSEKGFSLLKDKVMPDYSIRESTSGSSTVIISIMLPIFSIILATISIKSV